MILFCRCDCYCCDCDGYAAATRERIKLRAPPRGSVVSTLVPSHRRLPKDSQRRLTHVDTILIARWQDDSTDEEEYIIDLEEYYSNWDQDNISEILALVMDRMGDNSRNKNLRIFFHEIEP